jgi:hypothetical protein
VRLATKKRSPIDDRCRFREANQSSIGSKPANMSLASATVLSGTQSHKAKNLSHIACAVARDFFRAKSVERLAIVLPFFENRRSAQVGLRALEHEKLKKFSIVMIRHATFLIVVGDVWFSRGPGTTRHSSSMRGSRRR